MERLYELSEDLMVKIQKKVEDIRFMETGLYSYITYLRVVFA